MTKLEQIEKLREKANVSYEEAKSALEATNDDLLDAIIYLEKQGKVSPPNGGGYYSSAKEESQSVELESEGSGKRSTSRENVSDALDRICKFCVRIINKGNTSNMEVLKADDSVAKFPLTVLALLLIFLPWITIPLIIVGLVLGYRYRFNGIDVGDEA